MNTLKLKIILNSICILFSGVIFADCVEDLERAKRSYFSGNLEEISQFDLSCIESGDLLKSEKIEALKLLINVALINNEDKKADDLMALLLSVNPHYVVRDSDEKLFQLVYDKFTLVDQRYLSLSMGFNLADYQILKYHSFASFTEEPLDYASTPGIQIGANYRERVLPFIYGDIGLGVASSSYAWKEIQLDNRSVDITERRTYFNIDLQLAGSKSIGKFTPYISAGMRFNYLIKSVGDIDHVPLTPELGAVTGVGVPYIVNDYDLRNQRRRFTYNYIIGAGMFYQIKESYLLNFNYQFEYGLRNLVDSENRFADQFLLKELAYVPDDFKRDISMFMIGITKVILKPVKR